jgi:hypothetical protein
MTSTKTGVIKLIQSAVKMQRKEANLDYYTFASNMRIC